MYFYHIERFHTVLQHFRGNLKNVLVNLVRILRPVLTKRTGSENPTAGTGRKPARSSEKGLVALPVVTKGSGSENSSDR